MVWYFMRKDEFVFIQPDIVEILTCTQLREL